MTSALQDYHQFVHWIHAPENAAFEDARRVANIVLQRFTGVAGTSRQRNHRSNFLIGLTTARIVMRVGMTDLYVKENHAFYGVVTRGEYRELTRRLLRGEAVKTIISAKLAALPEDYDPWITRIERNRALRARYGDKFDPWGED